jgi:hypothetical protein
VIVEIASLVELEGLVAGPAHVLQTKETLLFLALTTEEDFLQILT